MPPGKKKSILIFDTNYQVQDLYTHILSLYKISCYMCPRHLDPASHARRLAVDGMILCLDQPLTQDSETIQRIFNNKVSKKNPLIVITGQDNSLTNAFIRQYYTGNILLKPFSMHQFQKIIKENFVNWWSRGESNP